MERGVLEEQVHYQASMYRCVNVVSGAYDVVKRACVSNDDQGSGLVFGHSAAGLRNLIGRLASCAYALLAAHEPVHDLLAFRTLHPLVSDPDEELAYFRLENDDECDHTDVQDGLHERVHQSHVEG